MSKNNKNYFKDIDRYRDEKNNTNPIPITEGKGENKDAWNNESREQNDINKYYISKPKIDIRDKLDKEK